MEPYYGGDVAGVLKTLGKIWLIGFIIFMVIVIIMIVITVIVVVASKNKDKTE